MEQPRDPKARAAAKLAARRIRLARIRRWTTVFAASVLCACCLVIGGQLAAGRDPALSEKTAQAQAKATNAETTTTSAGTDESESEADSESTEAGDESGATPATVAASPEPTPVATGQS